MRLLKNSLIFSLILTSFSLVVISLLAFKAGEEFQVNSYTSGDQGHPAVAMDEKGNFVMTWESLDQDGSGGGIFAKMFKK